MRTRRHRSLLIALALVAMEQGHCWTYITAANKTDGFGAQLQAKLSCILEARSHAHSMSYVHIPFLEVEHENLGASITEIEAVTNLGYGELHTTDLPEGVELEDRRMCHNWGDSHPHLYELLRPDLVQKLRSGLHRDAHIKAFSAATCGAAEVCVAVHIGRGNVQGGNRFLPNQHFSDIIDAIVQGLDDHGLTAQFSIYSEGAETDFVDIPFQEDRNIKLHLDIPMLEAWLSLGGADVLVTSHSSFSYSAALYNEGLTVYSDFWHSPLPSWITFHDSAQLTRAIGQQHVGVLLRKRLAARLARPESI